MRALIHQSYGTSAQLTVGERAQPEIKDSEVLVRVRAASINAGDWFMATGRPWPLRLWSGLLRPTRQLLGLDVAGQVVSVGAKVTRVRVGDAVFGETHGTFAEYAALSEARLAHKPEAVTFEQAATLPVAGCTALQGLRDAAQVKPGQRVLINGASGGVGSFAVQVARALGAEVTAVCSARNVARARALGAAQVIDYGVNDFAEAEQTYDAIFDLVGWTPLRRCLARLRPQGVYVSSAGRIARVLEAAIASLWPWSRVKLLTTNANPEDLATLASMTERGLITPEIDRYHPLEELPQALRTQGLGHARGKSVVVL